MSKVSRFQKIRDYLQANPGPRTAAEIAEGIGHEGPRINVSFAIGTMVTDGWLVNTTPNNKPARFALLRTEKIERPKPDYETKRKTKQDRERERSQAKRTMTPEQYQTWLQDCKKRSKDQKAADQAEALRIQHMAQGLRNARLAKQAKTEHAAHDRRDAARQVVAMRLDSIATSQASQPDDAETVEAYLARGGVIERLPPGQWSKPLMFEY